MNWCTECPESPWEDYSSSDKEFIHGCDGCTDTTPPDGDYYDGTPEEGGWYKDSVYLKAWVKDHSDCFSGVAEVLFRARYGGRWHTIHSDGTDCHEPDGCDREYTWDLDDVPDGDIFIGLDVRDEEDNWAYTPRGTILIHKYSNEPPSISFDTANGDPFPSGRIESDDRDWIFRGTASDPENDLDRIEFHCSGDDCGSHHSDSDLSDWTYERHGMKGKNNIYFRAYDDEGQRDDSRHLDLNIDLAAPSTDHRLDGDKGENGWYVSPVQVHLHAKDGCTGDACVGVDRMRYRQQVNDDGWGAWQTGNGANKHFTVSDDGTHAVEYYAVDEVGNTETSHGLASFKIDKTPPSAPGPIIETHGIASGQWQLEHNDPSFTWSPATDATSGVLSYLIDWPMESKGVSETAYTPPIVRTDCYTLYVYAVDRAGHRGPAADPLVFCYDGTPPRAPDIGNNDGVPSGVWQNEVRTADFSWPTPHDEGSGVAGYHVYWGPDAEGTSDVLQTENSFVDGIPICAEDEAATHYLRARSEDNVGLQSEWVGYALAYDGAPPTATLVANYGLTTTHRTNVHLDIITDDEGSGVTQMRLSNDAREWTEWTDVIDETYWEIPDVGRRWNTIYLQVRDGAGNLSEVVSDRVYFDVSTPRPTSESFWLWDDMMTAGGTVVTSANFNQRVSVGQSLDSPQSESASYILESGFQAGALAEPIKAPTYTTYSQIGYVIAGGGACTPTVQSTSYHMYGTLGQPAHVHTITSANYVLLSGFWGGAGWDAEPPEPPPPPPPPPPPECEFYSVTINDGALFTSDPDVALGLCGPDPDQVMLSNDGGFGGAAWEPYTRTVDWTLTTYGDYVLPRYVYARYRDGAGEIHGTFFDDIIYDPNAPQGQVAFNMMDLLPTGRRQSGARTLQTVGQDSVELFVFASDDSSGLAEMQVSQSPSFEGIDWKPLSVIVPTSFTEDGVQTVYVRFRDNAGNVSGTSADSLIVDTTPPTGTATVAEGVVGADAISVTVALSATDSTSGLDAVRVSALESLTDTLWQPYAAEVSVPVSYSGDQEPVLYVQFRDQVGNESTVYTTTYQVDTSPPRAQVEWIGAPSATEHTFAFTVWDDLSGVAEIRISPDYWFFEDVEVLPFQDTLTWDFSEHDEVFIIFVDYAGNSSDQYLLSPLVVQADFTAAPTSGVAPLTAVFTNTSSDYTASLWDFGDGVTSTQDSPTHTYTVKGMYPVTLTVTGPGGSDAEVKADYITVYGPINADFTASPRKGIVPLEVAFTNQSTGDYTASLWGFGDGVTSTLESPTHDYTTAGVYTVSLTVSGPGGADSIRRTNYVTVIEPPPVADFTAAPLAGHPPLAVVFTDTSTGGPITAWLWEFGDGEISIAQHPTHTYNLTGTFTVSLTATGPGGSDAEVKTGYIRVSEKPVIANFAAHPTSGSAPLTVQFTDDSAGNINSWLWSFGDGITSALQSPTHTYTIKGVYPVTLTVTGPGGSDEEVKTDHITVYEPASADFAAIPRQGIAPLEVAFTNQSTGDYTDSLWDFGDGITSTLQSPTHTYTVKGMYPVTLTVTGSGGSDEEVKTDHITVYEPVSADFAASPREGIAPLEVAFINQSTGDYTDLLWDFGDGITSTLQSPTHTYTVKGIYPVTLTVTRLGGSNEEVKTDHITVYEPVSADFTASPRQGISPLEVAFTNQSTGDYTASLWDFGDETTSTLESPTHTYTPADVYTASLTISGPGGTDILSCTNYVTVTEPPPVADFTAAPLAGHPPLTVAFTDTSTGGPITTWFWEFGDGVTSTAQHLTHTYTLTGSFTVSLTATGPGGSDTEMKSKYIRVSEKPLIANFTAYPTSGSPPLTVQFTDESEGSITVWLWSFGDGLTSTLQNPTHTYTLADTFTVSLTVSGPEGSDIEMKADYITVSREWQVHLPLLLREQVLRSLPQAPSLWQAISPTIVGTEVNEKRIGFEVPWPHLSQSWIFTHK